MILIRSEARTRKSDSSSIRVWSESEQIYKEKHFTAQARKNSTPSTPNIIENTL